MFFPVPGDPYYKNVALLLDCEGADTSTTIPDTGPRRLAVTAVGNAQLSTAQKPWGSSSLYLDGSGDYLTLPTTSFAMSGDFTIEAMVRIADVRTYHALLDGRTEATFTNFCCGLSNVGGTMRPDFVNAGGSGTRLTGTSTSVSLDAWTHLAFVRASGVLMAFVGGTKDATTVSYASAISPVTGTLVIGKVVDPWYFYGYIRDLRITIGTARYTADFTPPAADFIPSAWPYAVFSPVGQPAFVSAARLGL